MSGSLRLPVTISTDDLPIERLVGPFFFDLCYFGSTLVRGNSRFGVFNDFPTHPEKRRVAFNYKKFLDVMLHVFAALRETPKERGEREPLALCARDFYGILVPKDDVQDVHALRDTADLSELYSHVKGFAFFFLVDVNSNGDIENPFGALDVVLTRLMEENRDREQRSRAPSKGQDFPTNYKKRRFELCAQAMRNNASDQYGFDNSSSEFTECFTSPQDFKRMLAALFGPGYYDMNDQPLERSCASFSRVFNFSERAVNNELRVPYLSRLVRWNVDGDSVLQTRDAVAFRVDVEDVGRYTFPLFMFPDLRRCAPVDQMIPDLDTLEAVREWDFDPHVATAKSTVFAVLHHQMKTSRAACERRVARAPTQAEKKKIRDIWRKRVVPVFKSKFSRTGKISGSCKAIIETWENLTATHGAIPIHLFPSMRYGDLNAQQTFLAFMYDSAEDMGIYCQHSVLVSSLINARWCCRKGPGPRGPHMILYGPPGCGKSHVMETVKKLLDKGSVTSMSYFSEKAIFTNKTETGEENPDENFAQQVVIIDEMRASDIGFAGEAVKDRSQGENSDRVAVFKEMTSHSEMSYARNVESKNSDGISIRITEKATVTTEMVFIAGQNRPSGGMNSGFLRRFEMRPCCVIPRSDGITMEHCKKEEKISQGLGGYSSESNHMQNIIKAFQDNARLHAILGLLRFCGLVEEAPLDTWHRLVGTFEREVQKITSVDNLDDRLDDARHRLMLFVDMTAVALALQSATSSVTQAAVRANASCHLLSFDDIVKVLMEDVEAYAVPSEQACFAILGSLEEVCFPMFHKLVLNATSELEMEEHDDRYFALVGLKDAVRVREEPKSCAARILFDAIIDKFKKELFGLKMNEPELLMKGAIDELFARTTGSPRERHAVLSFFQDATGVQVLVSQRRLATKDVDISDVLRECLHGTSPIGRQLVLAPYRRNNRYAPQYAMYFDVTSADVSRRENLTSRQHEQRSSRTAPWSRQEHCDDEAPRNLDDACFERFSSLILHLDTETAWRYHPRHASFHNPDVLSINLAEWPEAGRLFDA